MILTQRRRDFNAETQRRRDAEFLLLFSNKEGFSPFLPTHFSKNNKNSAPLRLCVKNLCAFASLR